MVIDVDMDDVLVDFNSGLCAYHNARYGTSLTRKDITTYHLDQIWGCEGSEAVRRVADFYHSPEHADLRPVAGAMATIRKLQRSGQEVVVITSRPESVQERTHALLERYFPSLAASVHFTSHFFHSESRTTKGEVCQKLGVEFFVEDAYFHAEDVAAFVKHVLLFDTPWNQTYQPSRPNIVRVHSWRQVHALISRGLR